MSDKKSEVNLEDIVSLCKRRGFIFQGSEIYGGLAGTWDYGPLGVTLKKNLMNLWCRIFVEARDDMVGVDAAILMNPRTWQASGHVDTFTDPLTVCVSCNSRHRVDKIIESSSYQDYINEVLNVFYEEQWKNYLNTTEAFKKFESTHRDLAAQVEDDKESFRKLQDAKVSVSVYADWLRGAKDRLDKYIDNMKTKDQMYDYTFIYLDLLQFLLEKNQEAVDYLGDYALRYLNSHVNCSVCGEREWTKPQRFNMMFDTIAGPVSSDDNKVYLRPETAQGIFTNYKNVVDTLYPNVPFGIAQQGKAFRNEISPRDFVFRSREFEQMEIEYFIHESQWKEVFEQWRSDISAFLESAGVDMSQVTEAEVPENDLAHYSKRTIDYEFAYPHGSDELLGLAYRTDFDLSNIERESGKKMEYRPKDGSDPFVPHVIEPSFGVERLVMAVIVSSYKTDLQNGEERAYLKLPYNIAPVRYCVSPLLKNKPELVEKAREVYNELRGRGHAVMWDDNGNIGKRYRRQDEIGTPECIVVDFDTLEDGTVTVRDRDTTEQRRVPVEELLR